MRSDARKKQQPDAIAYVDARVAYDRGWTDGQDALTARIESALEFIGSRHLTPAGERTLRSILRGRD